MKFEDIEVGLCITDNDPRSRHRRGHIIEVSREESGVRCLVNWGRCKRWVRADRIGNGRQTGYTVVAKED